MDDVIFEEFKGTGDIEIILDRRVSHTRTFPVIDFTKSGTRKEEMLVDRGTLAKMRILRRILMLMGTSDGMEFLIDKTQATRNECRVRFDSDIVLARLDSLVGLRYPPYASFIGVIF
jgi:transcription termination factor Rho